MDLGIKDKIYMLAAGSDGLGFGIAQALGAEGAKLSIASRSAARVASAVDNLSCRGVEVAGYTFDARDGESIEQWARDTLERYGSIDGLLVNAGGPSPGNFESFNDDDWHTAFELTLLSSVRLIRAVLPQMKQQGRGAILTITSTSIKEPIEGLLLSNVFRSGVSSLVKSLSRELAPFGIRINNLVPGRIDTARVADLDTKRAQHRGCSLEEERASQEKAIPLGRYGSTAEFGSAAAYLLSPQASYITGATLLVDGGKTVSVW
jgi:3-oxoacyl-[acyl-carrier protein] reductase